MRKSESMIADEVIKECLRYGLIEVDGEGYVHPTKLGQEQRGRWMEYVDWVKRVEGAIDLKGHGPSVEEVK